MSRMSDRLSLLVIERDEGLCVMCGQRQGTNRHRRCTPGHGGRRGEATKAWEEDPANVILLCGSGTEGCHGLVTNPYGHGSTRAEVERLGYVVRRNGGEDPAEIPVRTAWGWETFTHDGKRKPCPAPGSYAPCPECHPDRPDARERYRCPEHQVAPSA